ncbi:hypothetical protein CKO38_05425 [Rhodospirillum rubrum]|uniref:hypothetical protein n=1 Tax=Rhodospirillum rubrum TaxID=1085 RepID=UPI001903263D|nr:hypothetical protein [Rhodospirillum rubrum]MBK1664363.1 hypothetical protein [Rhodospirillum rubrum]MBK1676123.1 hypothetical protein [Rhodospirillum rubrum]
MRAAAFHLLACLLGDRGLVAVAAVMAATAGLAAFLGSMTLVEGRESALVLAASTLRLGLALGVIALVGGYLDRLRQSEERDLLLSLPLSRLRLVVGWWLGATTVACVLTAVAALIVGALGGERVVAWGAGLALEGAVVAAFTVFAGISLGRSLTIGAALVFYAFARLSGLLAAVAATRAATLGPWGGVVEAVAGLMPRLDRCVESGWLIAAPGGGLAMAPGLVLQALGLILVVLSMAAADLARGDGR